MIHSVFRFLVLFCVMSLSGIAAVMSLVSPEWTAPEAQRPDRASLRPQVIDMPGTSASLVQIGQRPLFLESRRPHVPPAATVQPELAPDPDPFPDVELVGLFGSGGDAGVILKLEGEAHRIRLGMPWSGWQLESVDPVSVKAVFVAQGRGDHELRLKRQPQQGGMVGMPAEAVAESDSDQGPGAEPDTESSRAEPLEAGDNAAMRALLERRAAARDAALRLRQQRQ